MIVDPEVLADIKRRVSLIRDDFEADTTIDDTRLHLLFIRTIDAVECAGRLVDTDAYNHEVLCRLVYEASIGACQLSSTAVVPDQQRQWFVRFFQATGAIGVPFVVRSMSGGAA